MASSAVAALKKALLVALCVMLLPPPASPGCPYTGQQPPPSPTAAAPPTPTPTPVPAPMPTPTPASPAPAPSPTSCNYSNCGSQCTASCEAGYHPTNCTSLLEGAFNGCYESEINQTCPGKSCVHSGCGFGNCSCDNPHAVSACQFCSKNAVVTTVGSPYWLCQDYNERYMGNCMTTCVNGCSKNCTQPTPTPTPVVPAPTLPTPVPAPPTPTPTPVPAPMPTPVSPAPAPSPISCNYSDCASQCTPSCEAGYHPMNCTSLLEGAFNGCYASVINHTCPDSSCVYSGCGFSNCSCDNPTAVSACQFCRQNAVVTSPGSSYWMCQDYNERYMGNCMTTCQAGCSKNCTQQGA